MTVDKREAPTAADGREAPTAAHGREAPTAADGREATVVADMREVPMTIVPAVPRQVAVVGGGRMGAGIAQVFAAAGAAVSLVERDAAAAGAARDRIAAGLRRAAEKGKLAEPADAVLGRVRLVGDLTGLPADADLLVEAVPEDAALKLRVLTAAEDVVGEGTVLATNTSSLSVAGLAEGLRHPQRLIGMHFFNPVPASTLIEVVVAPQTGDAVRDAVRSWVGGLGRTGVVVRDSPGFATSRLGVLLGLEAIRMLEEGVADAAAIDRAMELGYRHPMGPLRSTDLVGLDVRLAIAEHLHRELGDRFAPPRLLREMVARGDLGHKTGRGFFTWEAA
jgi:3-hydroxybutyryl-CoA dehydrogenase